MRVYLFFLLFNLPLFIYAQEQASVIRKAPWNAIWITGPGPALNRVRMETDPTISEFAVLHFRKNFELASVPSSFLVHVSADNRYKLFVNEKLVSLGPSRGDLYYWNYETVDLASYLHQGKNTIAALVWNFAGLRPEAQISYHTGIVLQGHTKEEEIINTNSSWKTMRDSSYRLIQNQVPGYYVAGPGEVVDMKYSMPGWTKMDYKDSAWFPARPLAPAHTRETAIDYTGWMLVPSSIPAMELKKESSLVLRKAEGVILPSNFIIGREPVRIPPHTTATLLFDQGYLTNAYPEILLSGGKNARITIGYAESLYTPDSIKRDSTLGSSARFGITGKGNRNEVDGKKFIGTMDSIISDGSKGQNFTPLWWRTYRYIRLKIITGDDALQLDDLSGSFTGYPFRQNAVFESSDNFMDTLLAIGWRTARLCAFETYMDCPFYEQLQYIGDTRIQALVSLFNSGDDRLMRKALDLADHSRIAEGITLSRWPSFTHQQIPTFSLWYIGMLHDYFMYRSDTDFVKSKLPGMRQILSWFGSYQTINGSLKDLPFWNFTDWLSYKGWSRGMAPVGKKGESAVLDLQLKWTYQLAAEMEKALGIKELSRIYETKAKQLQASIQSRYWDVKRKLYADTEEKNLFSQHVNSLAILSDQIRGEGAEALAKKILSDTSIAHTSIYYKYYLHRALVKAGLGNHYSEWLDAWKENIRLGLSTWAEMSDVNASRSDCHAWGSSPNIEIFRTVLGIDSDAPGFRTVRIQPHPGKLTNLAGSIPHPWGPISVHYQLTSGKWNLKITLPKGVAGRLLWKGRSYLLKPGSNVFNL